VSGNFFSLIGAFLEWVIVPLLGLCLLNCLFNMRLLMRVRPPTSTLGDRARLNLSVLVPARNEERRIRKCLASLIAQEPAAREIILLDDRSTDGTARIARELGFCDEPGSRLRLIQGQELPEGWVGKNWACHQLGQAANPESSHLLFTDADTIHGDGCLQGALDHSHATRADLLSIWPDQITGTWSEKLVIPLGYLLFMAFQPFPLLSLLQSRPERAARWGFSRSRLASMGAANGQFLLFRSAAYHILGGHEALKDHLVEDIAFGRRVASRTGEGMRLINADGIGILKCRMYSGFEELWEGFSKNLRPVFEESTMGFLFFGFMVSSLFLLPCLALVLALPLSVGYGHELVLVSLTGVMLIMAMRLLLTLRFRTSWLGFAAHPFAMVLALLIAMNSWRLCRIKGVRWKGRVYTGATRSSLD
jgi:chlorobactene glucosyltransferase